MNTTVLRTSSPEIVVGAVAATLGVLLALTTSPVHSLTDLAARIVVALGTGAAVAISREQPGLALTLTWVLGLVHVVLLTPLTIVELALGMVFFTTARWGSALVATLAGLSIGVSGVVSLLLVAAYRFDVVDVVPAPLADALVSALAPLGYVSLLFGSFLGVALLSVPWLAGLVLRFSDRATTSRVGQEQAEEETRRALHESEQAREIAQLRDGQARLARDVHDVVGHSLAVILAQAESAQFLPDTDTEKLKATLATIATSARSSLQDVRRVLTVAAGEQPSPEAPRPLDTLVEGVRASGREVVSRELGTPQPLPPELEVVAYRVLQEMLTNAIKHGARDEPVLVERLWPDGSWPDSSWPDSSWPDGSWAGELRLEVRNSLAGPGAAVTDETQPLSTQSAPPSARPTDPADDGRGLDGMRRRLEACGGRLDVRRRDGERPGEPATFTTTAWVPVRTVSP